MVEVVRKLFDENGKQFNGSIRALAKESQTFTERTWEKEKVHWVTNPETGKMEKTYKLGKMVREIRYKSEYAFGSKEPYISVTYVLQNGKQIWPEVLTE